MTEFSDTVLGRIDVTALADIEFLQGVLEDDLLAPEAKEQGRELLSRLIAAAVQELGVDASKDSWELLPGGFVRC